MTTSSEAEKVLAEILRNAGFALIKTFSRKEHKAFFARKK